MSREKPPAIRLERTLAAPVERVFRAWTEAREFERWAWGSLGQDVRARVDARPGGSFEVSTARPDGARWAFSGTYLNVQANRRIAHTLAWDAPMGYGPIAETIVVEFTDADGGTALVFEHDGDFDERARQGHDEGWQNVLETLAKFLADHS